MPKRIAQSDRAGNFPTRAAWAFFLVLALAGVPVEASEGPKIEMTIGLESDLGSVFCALHSKAKTFPGDSAKAVATLQVKPKGKKAKCVFEKIPLGTYAVSAYHDSNGNGELDTNWLGIPKEGVGASNNAKGSMGPPKFDDAKFELTSKGISQKITLDY